MSSGKGKRGRHTSLPKELTHEVQWLEGCAAVSKVLVGRAENCRHSFSPGSVRVRDSSGGSISLKGYTGRGITHLTVLFDYTSHPEFLDTIRERYG